jgi:segregation and condensation protein B
MAEIDTTSDDSIAIPEENIPGDAASGDETVLTQPSASQPIETSDASVAENSAALEAESKAEVPIPESSSPDNPLRVLEALLFASEDILTPERIKAIVPGMPDVRKIRQMVEKINVQLGRERHPFEIVEIGGGYQYRTVSYYYPWVVQLFKEKAAKKLSIQSLECLAIISYKQPITKAEIESIRGVISDGAMKTLLEKRLVTISGRSEKAGRPLLYATTKEFLAYFGINKIADLPRIEEFEAMAKDKLGDLTENELKTMEAEKVVAPQEAPSVEPGADAPLPETIQVSEDTVAFDKSDLPQESQPTQNNQQ